MNFIYKNLFALLNLRPYTKHKMRIIPAIITGRISYFFLLLYYTLNSLCWLDGGPPYKNVVSKVGGPPESWGSGPPSGCALDSVYNWIKDFFQDHCHCTRYAGECSSVAEVKAYILNILNFY